MSKDRYALEKAGAGRAAVPPKPTSQRIIKLLAEEPGFSGLQVSVPFLSHNEKLSHI